MKKKLVSLFLVGAMVLSLTACGGTYESSDSEGSTAASSTASADASGEKVFRYSVNTEPTTLDPNKCNSIGDNEFQHAITENLVRTTGSEVEPGVAESWDISDDGLVYTFHLREAYWSDGEQITAQDYVYGAQRLMDPDTASVYAFVGEDIKNGAAVEAGEMEPSELGIKAIDDQTVEITLENPTAYFLSMLGTQAQFAPLRQDIVEEYGNDFAATADKNVYSGPFILESSDNNEYVFVKNENYWNADAVSLDRCECTYVADASTSLAMYESGDLDFVKIPQEQVVNYDDQDESYMNGNEDYLYINEDCEDCPILGNKNFRLALNYGLDRNTYIALSSDNVYSPCNALVMPLVNGVSESYGDEYDMESKSYPMDGDTDKALEYLQKAMDEEGISDAADISVEITTTDSETNKKIAEVIQQLWQEALGITVTIRQVTYSDIYGEVYPNGDYQVGYAGWGPDYSDPYTYLQLFHSGNTSYVTNYANDEVDKLLEGSRSETDAQKRMDMLNEAEQLILDDAAFVPLQLREEHYLLNEKVTGVTFYFCSVNIDWAFADITE